MSKFCEVKELNKKFIIVLSVFFVVIIYLFLFAGSKFIFVDVEESPGGEYQIVSWLIDKGGFGYSGAYYIKEKEPFSKWYELGTGPSSYGWLSDEVFYVHHSNPIDGNIKNYTKDNYYQEYNINDFFDE